MTMPVIQPNMGCVRPLWDLGSSTVETPHEWWSAICKQEVRGSIPRVSTQVRGPLRSSEGASFMQTSRATRSDAHVLRVACTGMTGISARAYPSRMQLGVV